MAIWPIFGRRMSAAKLCWLCLLLHGYMPPPVVQGRCDFPIKTENDLREQTMNCEGQTSVTFGFLADMGIPDGSKRHITAIVNSFRQEAASFDFVALGGDNFYADDGEDESGVISVDDRLWDQVFVDRYAVETMNLPWLATLGNHAYQKNAQAQIDFATASKRGSPFWTMPSNYYKVTIPDVNGKRIEINMMDTTKMNDEQYNWLDRSLQNSPPDNQEDVVRLVVGHHQIFSTGSRGDACKFLSLVSKLPDVLLGALTGSGCQNCDNICNYHGFQSWFTGKRFAELLSERQVSAYFCGHEHDMQILKKDDVHYFVVGGGGGDLRDNSFFNRLRTLDFFGSSAKSVSYQNTHGYGVFTIDTVDMMLNTTYRLFDEEGNTLPSVSWKSPLKTAGGW